MPSKGPFILHLLCFYCASIEPSIEANSFSIEPLLCQVKDASFCSYFTSIGPSIKANSCYIAPLLYQVKEPLFCSYCASIEPSIKANFDLLSHY